MRWLLETIKGEQVFQHAPLSGKLFPLLQARLSITEIFQELNRQEAKAARNKNIAPSNLLSLALLASWWFLHQSPHSPRRFPD
jgi:hypothetical protein